MSLIHEALKKAEQEKNPQGANKPNLPNPILPNGRKTSKRTFVLIGLLVFSLGFLIYVRLLHQPQNIPSPASIQPLAAIKIEGNPIVLEKTALKLYQENKLEESLATWEKLTLLLPTEAEVYNNMGLVLKKLGKREEAFQAYTKALALRPDYPELLNNLGVLYLENGQSKEAKTNWQKALELKTDYPDPYLHLGLVSEKEGNVPLAVQHYRKFLELSPELEPTIKTKVERKINLLVK